jgi:hypothetical protein
MAFRLMTVRDRACPFLPNLKTCYVPDVTLFVHIPLVEYENLAESGRVSGGFKNEKVCFDSDTGDSFKALAASKRVRAVFCGHDHVNNFFGNWQGIGLHYGRVSGWGGYGKVAGAGRLISLNISTGRFVHREEWF